MYKAFQILVVLIIAAVSSCKSDYYFTQPQPSWKRDKKHIPVRLSGLYELTEKAIEKDQLVDALIVRKKHLVIEKKQIVKRTTFDLVIDLETVKNTTGIRITDSLIYMDNEDIEGAAYSHKGDSLQIHIFTDSDTLFDRSGGYVFRRYKRAWYTSKQVEDKWLVVRLHKRRGLIILSTLNKKDMDLLKQLGVDKEEDITKPECDNKQPKKPVSVTVKQFKEFIKLGGFQQVEIYSRIQ
jgi:hypothetical protein